MNARRILLALLVIVMMDAVVSAQSPQRRTGWVATLERVDRSAGAKKPQQQSANSEDQSNAKDRDDSDGEGDSVGRREPTGSWIGTVSYNEFDYSFKLLSTFGKEGTFIAASEGDVVLDFGVANSAQHGVWARRGGNRFALKYLLLVSDIQTGVLIVTIRIRVNIELLSNNRWTGQFAQDEIYPDGTVFNNTASGTIEARRILEP